MIEIFSKRLLFVNSEEEIIKKGEVVFENATAGIYSVNIPIDGLYEVIAVGGGGGCGQMALGGTQYTIAVSASGGSGAVVRGIFKISAGTLSVIVGALGKSATISSAGTSASTNGETTSIGLLCSAGGGGAGKAGTGFYDGHRLSDPHQGPPCHPLPHSNRLD